MYLVGIIEKTCNTIDTSRILEEKEIYKKCTITKMNQDNLSNFKNVKFDVLIINYKIDNEKCFKYLNILLNSAKIIILNIDYKENIKIVENVKAQVITYGFNKKSTVTITSCEENNIILELQREIISLNNFKLKTMEIKKSYETGRNGVHFYTSICILEIII